MAKHPVVIIIKDWDFEEYYQQSLDYFHGKHFQHPDVYSEVKGEHTDDWRGGGAPTAAPKPGTPIGKQVR